MATPSEAAAECREILKLQPESTEAMVILGAAMTADGESEKAMPLLEHALTLDPRNAVAHFSLGLALLDRGQSHGALAQFNEATRLQPDNPRMLLQTAWMLATHPDATIRDGERAAGLARRAVELSGGQDARAFDALAAALAESEKFPAAIEAADHASAAGPGRQQSALGRRHRAAPPPLSPGLALSRAGVARPGINRRPGSTCRQAPPNQCRRRASVASACAILASLRVGWLSGHSSLVEFGYTLLSHVEGER